MITEIVSGSWFKSYEKFMEICSFSSLAVLKMTWGGRSLKWKVGHFTQIILSLLIAAQKVAHIWDFALKEFLKKFGNVEDCKWIECIVY